jgi:hypothetical protein
MVRAAFVVTRRLGQTFAEVAIVTSLVAIAALSSLTFLGIGINQGIYCEINQSLGDLLGSPVTTCTETTGGFTSHDNFPFIGENLIRESGTVVQGFVESDTTSVDVVRDGNDSTAWLPGNGQIFLQIEFPTFRNLTSLDLLIAQASEAVTRHDIQIDDGSGIWQSVVLFHGTTFDGQHLTHSFSTPQKAIRVRVLSDATTVSRGWREIKIYGTVLAGS